MSGGHFNYNQSLISEIADTIATEIARALLPKPQKVHEDYWTIAQNASDSRFAQLFQREDLGDTEEIPYVCIKQRQHARQLYPLVRKVH